MPPRSGCIKPRKILDRLGGLRRASKLRNAQKTESIRSGSRPELMRSSPGYTVGRSRTAEPPLYRSPPCSSGCNRTRFNEFRVSRLARSTQERSIKGNGEGSSAAVILLRGNLSGLPGADSMRDCVGSANGFSSGRVNRHSARPLLSARVNLSIVSRSHCSPFGTSTRARTAVRNCCLN